MAIPLTTVPISFAVSDTIFDYDEVHDERGEVCFLAILSVNGRGIEGYTGDLC